MPLGNVRWLGGLRGDSASGDSTVEDAFVFARARFRAWRAARSRGRGPLVRAVRPVVPGRRRPRRVLRRTDVVRRVARHARARRRTVCSVSRLVSPASRPTVTPARPFELPHTFFGVAAKATDRRNRRAAPVRPAGHPPRPAVPAAGHLQHLVHLRHPGHRRRDGRGDGSRRGARRRAVRHGRRLVCRRRRDRRFRLRRRARHLDGGPVPVSVRARQPRRLRPRPRYEVRSVGRARAGRSRWVDKAGLAQESWLATRDGDYGRA